MTVVIVVLHACNEGLEPRIRTSYSRLVVVQSEDNPHLFRLPVLLWLYSILFPGSVRHYLSLSVRIHDDKSPRRRGVLPSILQVSVFVAEIPLLEGSSASDG